MDPALLRDVLEERAKLHARYQLLRSAAGPLALSREQCVRRAAAMLLVLEWAADLECGGRLLVAVVADVAEGVAE